MVCKSQAVEHMFRLAHGSSRDGKVCAVIYGYFDDSGTHDASKLFCLCGFVGDPRMWDDLTGEWDKVLDKPDWPRRPVEFHMVDCVHGDGEFRGWSLAQRLAIFGDLSHVITNCNLLAIGALCLVDALASCTDGEREILERAGFRTPLDFIFQLALQLAISRTYDYARSHQPPIKEELSLVFDEEPPAIALRFHELYNLHQRNALHGDMLRGIAFEKSHALAPLQAADLLAYVTYWQQRKELFPLEHVDLDFPISPGFQRLIGNIAASGGIVHHQAIRTLLLTRAINDANRRLR